MIAWLVAVSVCVPGASGGLWAQSAAVRRIAREIVESFGKEALERAEPRVVRLIEDYGEEAVQALRRAGPSGVATLERFGQAGARIVARFGEDGVRVLAVEGEVAGSLLGRYGDEAIGFMLRHPGAGRELLERLGPQALRVPLTTESVVTLNRLSEPLRSSGRAAEILGVVERYGDRACQFLWRNKGAIFGTALLASFLADPKPYLDGVKTLVVEPARELAGDVASRTNGTVVGCVLVLGVLSLVAPWVLGRRKGRPRTAGDHP
jgi:hypothetical protein